MFPELCGSDQIIKKSSKKVSVTYKRDYKPGTMCKCIRSIRILVVESTFVTATTKRLKGCDLFLKVLVFIYPSFVPSLAPIRM
jgi:hypothetical protein